MWNTNLKFPQSNSASLYDREVAWEVTSRIHHVGYK